MIMEISFVTDYPRDTQHLLSIAHRIAILAEVMPSHESVADAGTVTYVSDDSQAIEQAYRLFTDVLKAVGLAYSFRGNGGNTLAET